MKYRQIYDLKTQELNMIKAKMAHQSSVIKGIEQKIIEISGEISKAESGTEEIVSLLALANARNYIDHLHGNRLDEEKKLNYERELMDTLKVEYEEKRREVEGFEILLKKELREKKAEELKREQEFLDELNGLD